MNLKNIIKLLIIFIPFFFFSCQTLDNLRYKDKKILLTANDEIEDLEDNMGVEPEIDKDHGSDIFGVNLAYRFNPNWSGSISWATMQEMEERIHLDSNNIGMQLNYRYFF